MPGPARVVKNRPRKRDQVGIAGPHDGLRLLKLGYEPDGDHRHARRALHSTRERYLIAWPDRYTTLGSRACSTTFRPKSLFGPTSVRQRAAYRNRAAGSRLTGGCNSGSRCRSAPPAERVVRAGWALAWLVRAVPAV